MLPLAAAIAISPIPIVAVILMLLSDRSTTNAVATLAGWALAIAVIGGIVAILGVGRDDAGEDPATGFVVAQFVIAALLLAGAARRWRIRPRAGEPHDAPKWMGLLHSFGPIRAFVLGVGLIGLNPKDLLLTIAAGARLGHADVSTEQSAIVLAIFVAAASATIYAPIVATVALGERSGPILVRSRTWLERHGNTAVAAVLLILGIAVAFDAIQAL
jgi:threonine/homoserine/homoserine lactone efflux protein